jgi:hypothetical protein
VRCDIFTRASMVILNILKEKRDYGCFAGKCTSKEDE